MTRKNENCKIKIKIGVQFERMRNSRTDGKVILSKKNSVVGYSYKIQAGKATELFKLGICE